jgi:phosphatidylglycerophosphate synthase
MIKSSKTIKLNLLHSYLLLASFSLDLYLGKFFFVPFIASFSFGLFLVGHGKLLVSIKPFGGFANWVTLIRLFGVFWIIGCYSETTFFSVGLIALGIVILDGLDGYLARKTKTATEFGAFFDMETDAFFCASMSFVIYQLHPEYWFVLIPGFLRYFYVVLIKLIGVHGRKERGHKLGKWFAVLFFISLISPFVVPEPASVKLLGVSSVFIVYSFSYSFWYLIRSEK